MTTEPARTQPLPDVAHEPAALARPLDWVGMDNIALPLVIDSGDGRTLRIPASVDVAVNLADAQARGIHMSRLYLRLQQAFDDKPLTPALLQALLADLVQSQMGASTAARLVLRFEQLLLRPALASDHHGWKAYPVTVQAQRVDGVANLSLSLAVEYSSTCPASTALSRQRNAAAFSEAFAGQSLSVQAVHDWLASPQGMAATPHAQRSRAEVLLQLAEGHGQLDVRGLVDAIEQALGTPVQTAVKREDEQAFAERNAANLMFCEDAARRIAAVLSAYPGVIAFDLTAAHLESLHAHDAVARASGTGPG